jgi:hypothetical protein
LTKVTSPAPVSTVSLKHHLFAVVGKVPTL